MSTYYTIPMMIVAALAPILQVGMLLGLLWLAYRAGRNRKE
jgi:hypothetical protein